LSWIHQNLYGFGVAKSLFQKRCKSSKNAAAFNLLTVDFQMKIDSLDCEARQVFFACQLAF
jgi:hypothetical protein